MLRSIVGTGWRRCGCSWKAAGNFGGASAGESEEGFAAEPVFGEHAGRDGGGENGCGALVGGSGVVSLASGPSGKAERVRPGECVAVVQLHHCQCAER